MITIRERASAFFEKHYEELMNLSCNESLFVAGAIFGATEQKQIDIEKACEWLKNNINDYLYNGGGKNEYIPTCGDMLYEDLRKAMEE